MLNSLISIKIDKNPLVATQTLKHAFDYWESRCSGINIPRRQDIDPGDIPSLLPDMVLLDYNDGLYRCRLAGTRVVENFGRELTGRPVDETLMGGAFRCWFERLEAVRHQRQPTGGQESLWWQDRDHRRFHWLCLPLASNGVQVDKMILCVDWD